MLESTQKREWALRTSKTERVFFVNSVPIVIE